MGRLSGFHYWDVVKKIKVFGFEFFCHAAGSYEIWRCDVTGRFTTIPNQPGSLPEGTLCEILKQAGIEPDDFLNKK